MKLRSYMAIAGAVALTVAGVSAPANAKVEGDTIILGYSWLFLVTIGYSWLF